jgi:hypothetical protein
MDFFPDFDELGIWGYIVPLFVILTVALPIWRFTGISSQFSILPRIILSVVFLIIALIVLCIVLLVVGGIIFNISN